MRCHNATVARKRQTKRFGQAVHGVSRKHTRARATGRTSVFLNSVERCIVYVRIKSHNHGVNQIIFFFVDYAGFHRSTRNENRRNVQTHGGNQHTRSDFVAVADAYESVNFVSVAHIFHAVGNNFT